MAVTKIWDIKGWVGKVVAYVENPDKTSMDAVIEYAMTDERANDFGHVIEYAADGRKTEQQHYVSALNCNLETAREEMMLTKRAWGKLDGITAFHAYQAFAPGEVDADTAHAIGVELAQKLWHRFEVVIATHLDKGHIHNHFVLNSVSFKDGYKYCDNKETYARMRQVSDKLCREFRLSVIENPQRSKTKHYTEWNAGQENRPTWRSIIKAEIDNAISQSMTEGHFIANLQRRGYEVKVGKDISVRPPGKERFFRLERNFGEAYSREGIMRQMQGRQRSALDRNAAHGAGRKVMMAKFNGNIKTVKKLTGFRALYFHYLYLMGKLPKKNPRPPSKVHFLFREDLIKIDRISNEITLLCRNRIDTPEQLFSFKAGLAARMETLTDERAGLRKRLRRIDEPEKAEVRARIALLSTGLRDVRRDVGLCDDIAERSGLMREKVRAVRQERQVAERGQKSPVPQRDARKRAWER